MDENIEDIEDIIDDSAIAELLEGEGVDFLLSLVCLIEVIGDLASADEHPVYVKEGYK